MSDAEVILKNEDISITELKTFAGHGNYAQIWKAYHEGQSRSTGFNFWAAFFGIKWFFYRKMYLLGVLSLACDTFAILIAGTLLTLIVPVDTLFHKRLVGYIILGVFILSRCLQGWCANTLYYREAIKKISSLSDANVTNEVYLSVIAAFGGTSILSVLGLAITAEVLGMVFVQVR